MRELHGTGIGRGVAAGPVVHLGGPIPEPSTAPSSRAPRDELATLRSAMAHVAEDLRQRGEQAGGEACDILGAQAMMAEDPAVDAMATAAVEAGATAARAAFDAYGEFRERLAAAGEYLAARVADLDDVRQRVVAACLGLPVTGVPSTKSPYVLVARDLSPADTAALDLSQVLALVTVEGGPASHTAILARSRGIPAVVACADAAALTGTVLVDAARGVVVVDPSLDQLTAPPAPTRPVATHPGRTADGHPVPLLANLGSPADVADAVAAGAEGVGLLRTEFLFLEAHSMPTAAEQEQAYRDVLDAFPDQPVVVRVLDAGADKTLAFLPGADEPNPALGIRGLRALRAHPDVLDTQLAALGAVATPNLAVMAPMVADAADAAWFVARARTHGLAQVGVMVEVPAAALTAGAVLAEADFASVGTNDLTQYTLAADRLIGSLAPLQDPWHPAVLRLVGLVGAVGKPVGVCGEAASDPLLACVLVGLGATSLSMAPAALADVRAALATRTHADCVRLARLALDAPTAAEARARVQKG